MREILGVIFDNHDQKGRDIQAKLDYFENYPKKGLKSAVGSSRTIKQTTIQ